jgi:hypothetical protein
MLAIEKALHLLAILDKNASVSAFNTGYRDASGLTYNTGFLDTSVPAYNTC